MNILAVFGSIVFLALILICVVVICKGCKMEDVFLTMQMMKLPEQNDPSGWYEAGLILMKKARKHELDKEPLEAWKKYKSARACFEEVFKYDPCYKDTEDHIQTCEEKLYKDFGGMEL